MKGNMKAAGIRMREAAEENPGSIGTVESYQKPLREAYHKIWHDFVGKVTAA